MVSWRKFGWQLPPSIKFGPLSSVVLLLVYLAVVLIGSGLFYCVYQRKNRFADFDFDSRRTWLPASENVHPMLLLLFRAAVLVYCILTLRQLEADWMFYTVWNFTLLTVYFFLSMVHSLVGLIASSTGMREDTFSPAGFTHKLQAMVYSCELPAALLVDVVVWTILVPYAYSAAATPCTATIAQAQNKTVAECTATKIAAYESALITTQNLTVHGGNGLFMMIELLLSQMPLHASSIVFVTWWALLCK